MQKNKKYCLILHCCMQFNFIFCQDHFAFLSGLPEYVKIKHLNVDVWQQDLSYIRNYIEFQTSEPIKALIIKRNLAWKIIDLGKKQNWSLAESFLEYQLLVHVKEHSPLPIYNSVGISRVDIGWDAWEFKDLPDSSTLKKYSYYKLNCGHSLGEDKCATCSICYHLQGIAMFLYLSQYSKNPLEVEFKQILHCKKYLFSAAWYMKYHLEKLAQLSHWDKETYETELKIIKETSAAIKNNKYRKNQTRLLEQAIKTECIICLETYEDLLLFPCLNENYQFNHNDKICSTCLSQFDTCPICRKKLSSIFLE